MTMEAWGQIVGIVATLIITSAYQANTKKGLLMIQSPGIAVLCVSYWLLAPPRALCSTWCAWLEIFVASSFTRGPDATRSLRGS